MPSARRYHDLQDSRGLCGIVVASGLGWSGSPVDEEASDVQRWLLFPGWLYMWSEWQDRVLGSTPLYHEANLEPYVHGPALSSKPIFRKLLPLNNLWFTGVGRVPPAL